MSLNLSKNYIINDVSYKIALMDPWKEKDKDEITLGTCNNMTAMIKIRNDMLFTDIRSTVAHEVTHAFITRYGFEGIVFDEEELCNFIGCYIEKINYIVQDFMDHVKSALKYPDEKESCEDEDMI